MTLPAILTNSLGSNASRRDFIKKTVVGSAATITSLSCLSIARSAHAAGGDVVKIGMIGCGGRCSGAAGQCMTADPGVKLVAMCDVFGNRLAGRAEESKKIESRAG